MSFSVIFWVKKRIYQVVGESRDGGCGEGLFGLCGFLLIPSFAMPCVISSKFSGSSSQSLFCSSGCGSCVAEGHRLGSWGYNVSSVLESVLTLVPCVMIVRAFLEMFPDSFEY